MMARHKTVILLAAIAHFGLGSAEGVTRTWDGGGGNMSWDTTSLNWGGVAWNNASKDVAVFDYIGPFGTISVAQPVTAHALDFTVPGYSLSGPGSITLSAGTSTYAAAGSVGVGYFAVADVLVPIHSTIGLNKTGFGTLNVGTQNSISGAISMFPGATNPALTANVLIGAVNSDASGGALKLASSTSLSPTNSVAIGEGYLDIGSLSVTVKDLIYPNLTASKPWNTTVNANNGVIGTGTLQVTGDINVIAQMGGNRGNSIAANLDLGGKTQMIRVGGSNSIMMDSALMVMGSISNGSIYKTYGYYFDGRPAARTDGMGLYGNNTYTGSTILNGGNIVVAGTNATTDVEVMGAYLKLQGANGSMLAAPEIKVSQGSALWLDNSARVGYFSLGVLYGGPNIPAAINNNRLADNARIVLNSGTFYFNGSAGNTSTETIGSIALQGGHNNVSVNHLDTGTTILTVANGLTMSSRSTLSVDTNHYSTVNGQALGTNAQLILNGTVPAADPTGILPRVTAGTDFAVYNPVTGVNRYTGYASDFSTAGANVWVTSSATLGASQTINALKSLATTSTGSLSSAMTVTLDSSAVLNVSSGMILNPIKYFYFLGVDNKLHLDSDRGTLTINGGTIAFGAKPGVLFSGRSMVINSALTGTDGLIAVGPPNAGGTTLTGNLSGLSGTITINGGTLTLASGSFTGPIEVRDGTLSYGAIDTAGSGDILLGNPDNDVDMIGAIPSLDLHAAGNGAVINRNIIVDNVTKTVGGKALSESSTLARISPLENYNGSQTINGNLTLNTSLNFQGGAGGATGATTFNGTISGTGAFRLSNGNVIFSPASTLTSTGGFDVITSGGWAGQMWFMGTANTNAPVTIRGTSTGSPSFAAYQSSTSMPTGTITFLFSSTPGVQTATLKPLSNSTINNPMVLNENGAGSVSTGITAAWNGDISGAGQLNKEGPGTLILGGSSDARTGNTVVYNGTLQLNNNGIKSAWAPVLTGSGGAEVKYGAISFAYSGSATSPASIVEPLMMAGYANGTFNNAANKIRRIIESPTYYDPDGTPYESTKTLGWADNGSAVVVAYTLYGDGNLDGKVNTVDFNHLAGNFGIASGGIWKGGDYNYDDAVNSLDFTRLAANYGLSMTIAAPELGASLGSVVPEPASMSLLVAAAGLLARRRGIRAE